MSEGEFALSARAQAAIESELSRFPDLETGGLLLGYSDAQKGVLVLEATDGGYWNVIHEPCCFQYDNAYEEHICTLLSELYDPPLGVVGLWHKHNNTSDTPFSHADEDLHRQLLAQYSHPCLSILFEKLEAGERDPIRYRMRSFLLGRSGHTDVSGQVALDSRDVAAVQEGKIRLERD